MSERELVAFKTRIAKDYPAYWELADYVLILEQERNNYKELYEKENKNWNELKELLKTESRDVYDKEHPLALDSSYIKYTTERKMNLMWVYEKMQEIERL